MKKGIKKLVLSVVIVLMSACNSAGTSNITKNELVKDYGFDMESELVEYIGGHFDKKKSYSLGNGIKVLDLDKGSKEELQVFPVYCEDELIFLVLYGNEASYLSDPETLNSISENDEYLILKACEGVYYASKEKLLLISNEKNELSDEMKKRIDKVRNGTIERNLMGIEKRTIRINSEQDKQQIINQAIYYDDRIAIRFASENIENKIRMYEAFCHGRAEEIPSDGNTYVFYFDPINSKNLGILLDASNGLSYVLEASLVERTESPMEEIDLTVPVTEKVPLE